MSFGRGGRTSSSHLDSHDSWYKNRGQSILAKNPIRAKVSLDWTWKMLLLWILTVNLRINSQPLRFNQSRCRPTH
jgi:hypothetical protein